MFGPPPLILAGGDVITEGTGAAWAVFSRNWQHRYLLGRLWDESLPGLVVGMINPSKAGVSNDPTIRRLLGFAGRDGFGGLLVWNACSRISTDPKALTRTEVLAGPRNEEAITQALRYSLRSKCVVAWGDPASEVLAEHIARALVLARRERSLWQFGRITKKGYPRHPVRLSAKTPLIPMSQPGPQWPT